MSWPSGTHETPRDRRRATTPWGPTVARETTAVEAGSGRCGCRPTNAPIDEIAGVVRVTDVETGQEPRPRHGRLTTRRPGRTDHRARSAARWSTPRPSRAPPAPIELTGAALEALLFVAEKPLFASEIAHSRRGPGDGRARLGDLEVSLRDLDIRLIDRWGPGRTRDGVGRRRTRRAVIGADVVRLSQASLETLAIVAYGGPSRRQPSTVRGVDSDSRSGRCSIAVRGRAWRVRRSRPAVPVRHRLRIPRAVRADEPRRARRWTRRGRAAGRGRWGTGHGSAPGRRGAGRPTDGPRTTPEGPRRVGVASRRRVRS